VSIKVNIGKFAYMFFISTERVLIFYFILKRGWWQQFEFDFLRTSDAVITALAVRWPCSRSLGQLLEWRLLHNGVGLLECIGSYYRGWEWLRHVSVAWFGVQR